MLHYIFHLYKIHFVQELHGDDTDNWVQFCEWFKSQRIHADNIMFSDEVFFHLNGCINWHNTMCQVQDNQHDAVDAHQQTNPRITVWCEIHGNTLRNSIPWSRSEHRMISPVVEWYEYVGTICEWTAPPSMSVLLSAGWSTSSFCWRGAKLDRWVLPGQWNGCRGPTAWPQRSPDIPLDSSFWGHLMSLL